GARVWHTITLRADARASREWIRSGPVSDRRAFVKLLTKRLLDVAERVPDRERAVVTGAARLDRVTALPRADRAGEAAARIEVGRHDPVLELAELPLEAGDAVARERGQLPLLARARPRRQRDRDPRTACVEEATAHDLPAPTSASAVPRRGRDPSAGDGPGAPRPRSCVRATPGACARPQRAQPTAAIDRRPRRRQAERGT